MVAAMHASVKRSREQTTHEFDGIGSGLEDGETSSKSK